MQTALLLATITTTFAVATGGTLIAPAGLAAADSAVETIGLLEAQGYTVNPYMLCAVAAALALYQYFMTHASCSELSKMFKDNFADSERQTGGREE